VIRSSARRSSRAIVAGVAGACAIAAISTIPAVASPPIALEPGQFTAEVVGAIDLDKSYIGKEISLSPDVWIGLPHAITIGAIESDQAVDRLDSGSSICVVKTTYACDRALHNGGLDARIAVTDWFAPRVRVLVRDVDPWKPAATVGALLKRSRGRWTLWSDPYLRIGLENTDRGNRAYLVVPVYIEASLAARRVDLAFHTGYDSELVGWRDDYHVPAAIAARVRVGDGVELGAEGGLRTALGPQNSSGYRTLMLSVAFSSPSG
jgi:hypothetical protein